DPDGFRTMSETIDFLSRYANSISAPVETHTQVSSVREDSAGYLVNTNSGAWRCRCVVVASGACNIANVPEVARSLPADILSLTPHAYRNPHLLPESGVLVVGASATGVQLAQEI